MHCHVGASWAARAPRAKHQAPETGQKQTGLPTAHLCNRRFMMPLVQRRAWSATDAARSIPTGFKRPLAPIQPGAPLPRHSQVRRSAKAVKSVGTAHALEGAPVRTGAIGVHTGGLMVRQCNVGTGINEAEIVGRAETRRRVEQPRRRRRNRYGASPARRWALLARLPT